MVQKVLLISLFVLVSACAVSGLSCPICKVELCDPTPVCNYGIEKDACHCCDQCKGGLGDRCKGPWGVYGTCGKGFKCDAAPGFQTQGKCVDETDPDPVDIIQQEEQKPIVFA